MRFTLFIILFLVVGTFLQGQEINWDWYSETTNNGITIQNSFPKGGPYTGPTQKYFNHSYLVFFTRVINETDKPVELSLNFLADSIAIPNSPGTYMKLFLPPNKMTLEKQSLFSYGVTELQSFYEPTSFKKIIKSKEDCLFYVVAFFYQTKAELWNAYRGGNRAELVLKGKDLFYSILPQVDLLECGRVTFK